MTSLAGTLRRKGLGYEPIVTALKIANLTKCDPPLPEHELEVIARSIASRRAGDPNPNPAMATLTTEDEHIPAITEVTADEKKRDYTDTENAVYFAHHLRGKLKYDHARKSWMVFNEELHAWLPDRYGSAARLMTMVIELRLAASEAITDPTELARARKGLIRAKNGVNVEHALRKASVLPEFSTSTQDYDANPIFFNAGQLLDLSRESMAQWETNPEAIVVEDGKALISQHAGAIFAPWAIAPRWLQFLDEVFDGDEALIRYVQKAVGLALNGRNLEQLLFILYGEGANGKSVFLRILGMVFGTYHRATAMSTFDADSKNQYGDDMAALHGSRIVTAVESERDRKLAEAKVKLMTGGDPITCRFLHANLFTFWPQFTIFLALNHRPSISGRDHAIWRRIALIPFTRTFDGDDRDPELEDKLAAELPGILTWALDGLAYYYAEGLVPPASVQTAKEEYRSETDFVGQWLAESAEALADDSEGINSTDAFTDYRLWSEERGEGKMGQKLFTQNLLKRTVAFNPEGTILINQVEEEAAKSQFGPDAIGHLAIRKDRKTSGEGKGKMFLYGFRLPQLRIGRS